MRHFRFALAAACLALPASARAGLYYSGEPMAELPSQWRGFLLDQRTLRGIAIKPDPKTAASPARIRYEEAAAKLEALGRKRPLTADELADLGALYVRLGEPGKAIVVLRPAQRAHPRHFHIAANLGTAFQLQGDLQQAALCLEQSVRLAPGKYQKAEEYHLKLVRLRLRDRGDVRDVDDLFGVRYVDDRGDYTPGKLAAAEKKKLPASAAAIVQQLALWLPSDARLLWQLAELANAHGDVRYAAAMMDGCVTQFGLQAPLLRRHRQLTRTAADALAKADPKAEHGTGHTGGLQARSKRPLLTRLDASALPPISATGVNELPWPVLADTTLDRKHRPTFPQYLKELEGKQVTLSGFMQPLRDDPDVAAFMFIEYPVGCWYCEMPEVTGIVFVELPAGQTTTYTRSVVRVTGRLALNPSDPEDFLFTIRQAKVSQVD
jgi:tetratricopeptide (TPR) repeat protein